MPEYLSLCFLSCGAKCTLRVVSVSDTDLDYYLSAYGGYSIRGYSTPHYDTIPTWLGDFKITCTNIEDGYEFVGWYTTPSNRGWLNFPTSDDASVLMSSQAEISTQFIFDNAKYVEGIENYHICYPKFRRRPITCTYNGNGGTPSRTSDALTIGGVFPTLPTASRIGYSQNGWWTSASGGFQVKAGDEVTQTSDFTLYAHWTANTYTVTLNTNGGSGGTSSVTATYGSTMPSATMPTRPGYTFQGFYDTSSSTGGTQYYNADGSSARTWDKTYGATLYARWTPNNYTVTFNANGGGTPSPSSKTVTYKSTYGTLATVSRPYYGFLGWFTDPNGGTKVNPTDTYNTIGNQTLYAHWIGNELVVTYDPNGGTSTRYFDRVRIGGTFPALPTATWGSDTTSRWYTAKTGGTEVHQGDTVTQTEDFMLYAHWSVPADTYTIFFVDPTGTNQKASRTFQRGVATRIPYISSGLGWTIPPGYTVDQSKTWCRTPVGLGGYFANRELVTDLTDDDTTTLYAVFTPAKLTITLNPNGGTVSPATKSVENGSVYGILPRPTRSGFIFDGWWTAATGGTKITATSKPSGNQTVYAHWKQDGGEVVPWVF